MTTTIQLPDDLSHVLREKARRNRQSLENHVIEILRTTTANPDDAIDHEQAAQELQNLVKNIRSHPSTPSAISEPRGSLAEVLAAQPEDPTFDLEQWDREWLNVERELKLVELEDAVADLITGP